MTTEKELLQTIDHQKARIAELENRLASLEKGLDDRRAAATVEAKFQSMVENLNQFAIFQIDPAGNFVYLSPGFKKLTGYDPEELINQPFAPLIHPEDLHLCVAALKTTVESGQPVDVVEYRTLRKEGTLRWQSASTVPLRDDCGRVIGLIGIGEDISDRIAAEEALKHQHEQLQARTQELEALAGELKRTQLQMIQSEKMSSLGQMVSGVAHEINNPVNFIHGNLAHVGEYIRDLMELIELYEQHCPEPSTIIQDKVEKMDLEFMKKDLQSLLQSMNVGTNRIREIVLSLRNFSRLDESEVKDVDIHDGINNTLTILQNRLKATATRPEIEVVCSYGDLPHLECYAGQLNQVFMNILSNAIDALEESNQNRSFAEIANNPSSIEIKTTVPREGWIRIEIADNGPGIPEEVRSRLFDPFFTTKPVGKGTGLGLSISHQIITERHNGAIQCESSPGLGTKFIIELPTSLS